MPHLKRFFWLAASSLWAWLGLGLHRELPRELGPALCTIPHTPRRTRTYGFDGPSRLVVGELNERGPKSVAIYDPENGACLARFPMPELKWNLAWVDSALHHGHVVVKQRDQGTLQAIDLSSGIGCMICPQRVLGFSIHPTKPLVAFTASTDRLWEQRIAVFDLRTRQVTFDEVVVEKKRKLDKPIFIDGTDKLIVMGTFLGSYLPSEGSTVFLCTTARTDVKPTVERLDVGLPRLHWATTSRNGRIAFDGDASAFTVFDIAARRILFSRPEPERGPAPLPPQATQNPALISATGRTVLGGWPQTLWDVDAGAPLWKARTFDFAFPDLWRAAPESVGTHFVVLERWHDLWKNWIPNRYFTTLAIRSAIDGTLCYRVRQTPRGVDGTYNADWSLVIADDNNVYHLPPAPNWPLLALCQSILASPLIFLWTLLRWRRRRAARRRPAHPDQVST